MSPNFKVTVIGCGVIGLSCGLTCLERGWDTEIIARDLPPLTDSNKAGAVWFPFKAAPRDLVARWSGRAYGVFAELARLPASGVHLTTLFDLHQQVVPETPWWAVSLPRDKLRKAAPAELPPGYVDGFALEVPIIQTDKYLDFLMERFLSRGGVIRQQELNSLEDLDRPVLVNCTGLGAGQLTPDPEVYPISGHMVVVQAKQGLRCLMDEYGKKGLAYVFPRPDLCKLGGTAVEHDWNESPDPATLEAILARCQEMEPHLADAEVIGAYKGLRPGRREIRFEMERAGPGRLIFHHYGHGGSGYTVSWGGAQELAQALSGWNG
jgi:D-amino-acid oxidase